MAGTRVTTYNSKKVTCALGSHIVTGFADDSFISVEESSDGVSTVSGADGELARSVDPSELFTLKLSLQQQSRSNKWLTQKYYADKTNESGTFSVNIKDLLGKDNFVADVAWVTKLPTVTKGKTQNNLEWTIAAHGKRSEG